MNPAELETPWRNSRFFSFSRLSLLSSKTHAGSPFTKEKLASHSFALDTKKNEIRVRRSSLAEIEIRLQTAIP
jgi:hypothetical protein